MPERVSQATAEYRATQDHVGRFLADYTVAGDDFYVSSKALRGAYESWCDEQGEHPWTAQAVGRELSSRGFDNTTIGTGNAKQRAWLGIGLITEGAGV